MDRTRAFFQIKHGESLGDRLVLRFPGKQDEIVKAIQGKRTRPPTGMPGQITIGYYLQLDDPDGAWAFMPVNTDAAKAVLTTRMVQNRIAEDLLSRM